MLIPYFMAYLYLYFYNLKRKCDRQKLIAFLISAKKIFSNKKNYAENKQSKPLFLGPKPLSKVEDLSAKMLSEFEYQKFKYNI